MQKEVILTPEGKQKLEAELKNLKEVKLPEIIDKIEEAKEMGDLSENAEYHDAKDQQGMMITRINEIEDNLKYGSVQENSTSKDKVSLGATFVVETSKGDKKEFTLVGFNEADPINGRISNESPMGIAFNGAVVGENVEVQAPKGLMKYKVLEIK